MTWIHRRRTAFLSKTTLKHFPGWFLYNNQLYGADRTGICDTFLIIYSTIFINMHSRAPGYI